MRVIRDLSEPGNRSRHVGSAFKAETNLRNGRSSARIPATFSSRSLSASTAAVSQNRGRGGLCSVPDGLRYPAILNSRTKLGTAVLKHNVLRYSVLISILGCHDASPCKDHLRRTTRILRPRCVDLLPRSSMQPPHRDQRRPLAGSRGGPRVKVRAGMRNEYLFLVHRLPRKD